MKTLYFILFMNLTIGSYAQLIPTGTQWYYGEWDEMGINAQTYYQYSCIRDTTINGDIYSEISCTGLPNFSYFLRQQGSKIYYWFDGAERLLFDTNYAIGDTLNIDVYYSESLRGITGESVYNRNVRIESISWQKNSLNPNDSLKSYHMVILNGDVNWADHLSFTEKVINGKGKMTYALLNLLEQPIIPEGGNYLRCYEEGNYHFKSEFAAWLQVACDYVTPSVGINELNENGLRITVYPNPASDQLTIEGLNSSSKHTIHLYDYTGRLIYENLNFTNTMIDTRSMNNGMYYIRCSENNDQYVVKKFIIER